MSCTCQSFVRTLWIQHRKVSTQHLSTWEKHYLTHGFIHGNFPSSTMGFPPPLGSPSWHLGVIFTIHFEMAQLNLIIHWKDFIFLLFMRLSADQLALQGKVMKIDPNSRSQSSTSSTTSTYQFSLPSKKHMNNKVAGWYGALACTTFLFFVILSSGTWNVLFVVLLKSPDVDAHEFRVAGPWLQEEIWCFATAKRWFQNWNCKKKH